jgi:restriction endonuclease S subunit
MGYLDNYDFEGEYITWTTDGANAGTVFYRNGKFNCTNVCGTIKLKENHNPYFVAQSLQLETRKYVSINLANPKLMNNVMASIEIYLPEISLQNSISNLLQSIDSKINTECDYMNNLTLQKKYLLSQMFI